MIRRLLLLALLCLTFADVWAQCVSSKNSYGQVVTTCDIYDAASSHITVTYLGTPYLTFPTFLNGTIQLDRGGQTIACELAYDLVTNTVMCRFDGSKSVNNVAPYAFTIHGITFVRQLNSVLGVDYPVYLTALNTGQTTLAKRLTSRLVPGLTENKYVKSSPFQGTYTPTASYYIRKGDAQPQLTNLSRKSLLEILYDQAEKIALKVPNKSLSPDEVIQVLQYYDSLTTVANADKPSLSTDPAFNQFLREEIKYPG